MCKPCAEPNAAKKSGAAHGYFKWLISAATLIFIFLRPQAAAIGVQRAMRAWYTGIAPALLPFLALMPMLTDREACRVYQKLFSKAMRKCFGLSGEATPAVIAALISGSPSGAAAICRVYKAGGMTDQQAARVALATGGVSPAYLALGVGVGMLRSQSTGLKLAAIQLAVQLLLLKTLEKVEFSLRKTVSAQISPEYASPMRFAVETTLSVCGYMAVFGACGSVAAAFVSEKIGVALLAMLDLPSGMALIAQNGFTGDTLAIGATLGFGGACIAMQNLEQLRCIGIRKREYFAVRLIAASASALLCAFFLEKPRQCAYILTDGRAIYRIALLAAAICALPGMAMLSISKKKSE